MNATYQAAIDLLHRASTPHGFLAADQGIDNYSRIWTRDSVVCGLAALASGDIQLIDTFKQSLQTILSNQHPLGLVPSNVNPSNQQEVSFGGPVGRADTPAWLVLGIAAYGLKTGDLAFTHFWKQAVERALITLDYWEFNAKHLVYVPRSGDWADESDLHGYLLSTQLLRLKALELAAELYQRVDWKTKAFQIREAVKGHFHMLTLASKPMEPSLRRIQNEIPEFYWIAGFNPGKVYLRFDLLGNALALWTQIGNDHQNHSLCMFLHTLSEVYPRLLPAFYPEINNSDTAMEVLKNNYSYRFRNEPGSFHNGGLWPVWHGWMTAACKNADHQLATRLLNGMEQLANSSHLFNECYQAQSLTPNGVHSCSWSAAGFVLAMKGLPC